MKKYWLLILLLLLLTVFFFAFIWYGKNESLTNLMVLGSYLAGISAVITAISSVMIAFIVHSLTKTNHNTIVFFQEIEKLHGKLINNYYNFKKASQQGSVDDALMYDKLIKNDSMLLLHYLRAFPLKTNLKEFEKLLSLFLVTGIRNEDDLKNLNMKFLTFCDEINPNKLFSNAF